MADIVRIQSNDNALTRLRNPHPHDCQCLACDKDTEAGRLSLMQEDFIVDSIHDAYDLADDDFGPEAA